MSAFGPKQTSLAAPHMSAFGGKADMALCGNSLSRSLLGVKRTCLFAARMSAFDPKRTFGLSAECGARSPRGQLFRYHPPRGRGFLSGWRNCESNVLSCCNQPKSAMPQKKGPDGPLREHTSRRDCQATVPHRATAYRRWVTFQSNSKILLGVLRT